MLQILFDIFQLNIVLLIVLQFVDPVKYFSHHLQVLVLAKKLKLFIL